MAYYCVIEETLWCAPPWRLQRGSAERYCSIRQQGRSERFQQCGLSLCRCGFLPDLSV
jgi:hypothetical protein